MVIDTGLPLGLTRDILEMAAPHIDFWKFGFGSASVCPPHAMVNKVALCQEYGILAYPGGTSLEIAVLQNVWTEYLDMLWDGGVRVVEVSDGTITLPLAQRREIIRTARHKGFTVLAEVGKKERGRYLDGDTMASLIHQDLTHGAHYVIVEGREGGKGVGVFQADGGVKEDAVDQLLRGLGPMATRVIWEAPLVEQQIYYLRTFGHKVNLGNIKPLEVIALESLRRGLRSDTLREALPASEAAEPSEASDEMVTLPPAASDEVLPRPTLWTQARTGMHDERRHRRQRLNG